MMRSRDTIIRYVCLLLAVLLLWAAGSQLDSITSQRQDLKLTLTDEQGAPPSLAFVTAAMGAFRGLIVDVLWMRADQLKEEGQFFDAKQLAEWITMLQPRFAAVWEFHAWNMAYNISVAIPASQPDQRWKWVKNGYELLRDQGIPLNPKSIELYRELARIFQQKIGGISDDAHKHYKLRLASSMAPLLGPADREFYQALAAAPATWNELLADPNMTGGDPNIQDMVRRLTDADERFSDRGDFVGHYLVLRSDAGLFEPAAGEVIDLFRGTKILQKFDIFARGYFLRNVWKMDPVLMQDLNEMYGPTNFRDPNDRLPLDWRHPDCHAMYWGIKGLRMVAEEEDREIDSMEINTDRIVGHSLQSLFRNGKIHIYEETVEVPLSNGETTMATRAQIFLRPDLRMFDPYSRILDEVIAKYEGGGSSLVSLQDGHRNMLKNAVLMFYQAGHEAKATEIFNDMKKQYPREEFRGTMVEYAQRRFMEELESIGIYDAREQIVALLREAYFRFAIRDDDAAAGREKLAKQIWNHYQSIYRDENRIDLPVYNRLKLMALYDFLDDGQYAMNFRMNLLGRIKVEQPELYEELERLDEMQRSESGQPEQPQQPPR